MAPAISIVIPTLDEAANLPLLLADLAAIAGAEVIVCDGGSRDATVAVARAHGAVVVEAPRGRARQLRAGADAATADLLLFLHADVRVPEGTRMRIGRLRACDGWGFFRPELEGRSPWLPVVARLMHGRSRLSGIATGDQGLFVSRALYDRAGGYPDQPLMEDIALSARLRRLRRPRPLPEPVRSSGRRWDRDGAVRTILLMWSLRLRYALGADPARLHRAYYRRDA